MFKALFFASYLRLSMRIMVFWTLILKFDIVSVIELLFLSESLG